MFQQGVKEVDQEKIQVNSKQPLNMFLQGEKEEDLAKTRKIKKLFVYSCNNRLWQKEKNYLM